MDESQPLNRRERQFAARREQIIQAAAHLFASKGFHRTTTKDIAEAAQVSEGTLYNYIDNKDDLLIGIMDMLTAAQQMGAHFDHPVDESVEEFLLTLLRQRREYIDEIGPMLQSVLSEILVDPVLRDRYYQEIALPEMQALERHLQARIDMGQLRNMRPDLAARILTGLITGLYILEVLGDPLVRGEWDDLSQSITGFLFQGDSPQD
ncbi:MAG: TetR/AcrR family transcriptional regulator [Chloroflexi bacterium]|nr:TetR/AcrR family transcriptional regulator [Chloroflexota bacterium]